jgi:pilus assembly protein CpaF
LFRASLRLRPDRIVVGEIRGGEALDLIQAMTSGHGGCLSTVHATRPRDTLSRLETMASMTELELPLSALRSQIAAAVDFIVQTGRDRRGRRRVTEIAEVLGTDPERGYHVETRFESRQCDGTARLVRTGRGPSLETAESDDDLTQPRVA